MNDKAARAVAGSQVEASVLAAPIFISHSSKDRAHVLRVCKALEARGLVCWMSFRDVSPGDNFQQAIVRAIRAAKVMVLVFTDNANSSREIQKELALASQLGVTVIPARVENVDPSEAALVYELSTRQWIDLFENWDEGIERLVLATNIGVAVSVSPVRSSPASN
ncbi:toll/interleukin-1 receptor domain-containing protein [Bradyrhizobium sp. YCK136]|uniref:toll/interleukin-1 receptor domain-containing protein n=1 Tax=Bradyrhizobium sp. YCK136 TaxID=3351346 RepID=UPI0037CBEE3C